MNKNEKRNETIARVYGTITGVAAGVVVETITLGGLYAGNLTAKIVKGVGAAAIASTVTTLVEDYETKAAKDFLDALDVFVEEFKERRDARKSNKELEAE